jgi:hypothetical protein
MNQRSSHPESHEHPAGDRELQRLETTLHEAGGAWPVPVGLAERVYEASVSRLPRRRLRLVGTSRAPIHTRLSGRLAMAASLGMAFVVAAWFMQVPLQAPDGRVVSAPSAGGTIQLAADRQMQLEYWGELLEPFNDETSDMESFMAVADLTLEEIFDEARHLTRDLGEM